MKTDQSRPTIVFFDLKTEHGGGQVVLEDLFGVLHGRADIRLVMPEEGFEKLKLAHPVPWYKSPNDLLTDKSVSQRVLVVCNASSSMPTVLATARKLKKAGKQVFTLAIVHNYPLRLSTKIATPFFLSQFDEAVAVEPGSYNLRRDVTTLSWLSLIEPLSWAEEFIESPIRRTGVVKSYQRPDREKGLDLLPEIFGPLTELGYTCKVALGRGFNFEKKYVDGLRRDLAPWLVEGHRNRDWIHPGDVFLIPTRQDTASLLTQEVLSKGAFAITSRVGVLPYLSPVNQGIRTFAMNNTKQALRVTREVLEMDEERFAQECLAGVRLIEERAGRWHREAADLIIQRSQDI